MAEFDTNIKNYIDGAFKNASSKKSLTIMDPAKGIAFAECPDSDAEDAQDALQAADKAFEAWSKTSVSVRANILENIARLIESNLDELAEAESLDNGKPVAVCKKIDIPRAADNFRFFSRAITQFESQCHEMGTTGFNYTLRQPLGAVVCISPWNLPLYLFTWKIAPALAAGNTVVGKPSEVTPLTAFLLAKICKQAGLPDGVLNICHGKGHKIGHALITHPLTKAVSFTGGSDTGRAIAAECAKRLIPCSLELGGKNPAIIYADCDFEKTVDEIVRSSFTNQGQICLCSSRVLVEENIYESFREAFIDRTKKLIVGPPNNKLSDMSALVSKEHFEKIKTHIQRAVDDGATILTGGSKTKVDSHSFGEDYSQYIDGYYLDPTILVGLDNKAYTNQNEIFGPVVTLQKFQGMKEAIALANDTIYGLSATIWTKDLKKAHLTASGVHAGIIWINTWLKRDLRTPFGGMKESGLGREGGHEALRFFTEPKNVCVDLN